MSQPTLHETWKVRKGDFATAGEASGAIKRLLKQIGVPAVTVRRVAVATYEVELNQVIHSLGGTIALDVDEQRVRVVAKDTGPGIPDIELAMREGYSTATDSVRNMGFGAGMGLPNMRRNADEFDIQSAVGAGTTITMTFSLQGGASS